MRSLSVWLLFAAACVPGASQSSEPATAQAERRVAHRETKAAPEEPAPRELDPAKALFYAGRYDELVAHLESNDEVEPALRAIARAHLRRGRVDEALEALARVEEPTFATSVDVGEALLRQGRVHEARAHLMRPIEAYNRGTIEGGDADSLFAVARAARALGSPKDANAAFREALLARPSDPEIELAWAQLFLEAHAPTEAAKALRVALEGDPENPDAHALLAEVRFALGAPPGLARESAAAALERNPSHVGARVFLAGLALRHRDVDAALRDLEMAESVDPADPRLLATRGALAWMLDRHDEFRAVERRALELNPRHSGFYETIAEFAEYGHRYAEGVELAEKALSIDPRSARALARRGINLLRLAREDEGRRALESAFRLDPFDVRVFNTLELYDRTIDREYELFESAGISFRMHLSERPILERHVPKLAAEALGALASRYRFRPRPPIQIELYADPDDFAVRTSGLPGLGLQGVCFGHVITAVSPKGGPFNWGQILWHELAHVVHLQLSRARVPRWLTEGLAERESELAPYGFVRPMDHHVAAMLREGRIPSLADFDGLFLSARSARELVLAYALAAEAGAFLDERFGPRALRALLVGFGEGGSFASLAPSTLGMDVGSIDAAFHAHLRSTLKRFEGQLLPDAPVRLEEARRAVSERPRDALAAARHARSLLRGGASAEAREEAERALGLDAGQPEAHLVLARLDHRRLPERAAEHLERLLERSDGVEPRLMLAAIRTKEGAQAARSHLERAATLDPRRREPWDALRRLARAASDLDWEREALEAITSLEIHEREPHLALLALTHEAGDYRRLAQIAERAVFVAPHDSRVHEARLIAWASLGRAREALEALEDLGRASSAPRHEVLEEAAAALDRAGSRSAARRVRAAGERPR